MNKQKFETFLQNKAQEKFNCWTDNTLNWEIKKMRTQYTIMILRNATIVLYNQIS